MFRLPYWSKVLLVYVSGLFIAMSLMARICFDKIQIAELRAQQAELLIKLLQQTLDISSLKAELAMTIQARIEIQKRLEELIAANSSTSTLAIVGTVIVSVVAIGAVCLLVSHGILLANQHTLYIASMTDGLVKGIQQRHQYLPPEQVFPSLVHKTKFLIEKEMKLIAAIERLEVDHQLVAASIIDFINLTST